MASFQNKMNPSTLTLARNTTTAEERQQRKETRDRPHILHHHDAVLQ